MISAILLLGNINLVKSEDEIGSAVDSDCIFKVINKNFNQLIINLDLEELN